MKMYYKFEPNTSILLSTMHRGGPLDLPNRKHNLKYSLTIVIISLLLAQQVTATHAAEETNSDVDEVDSSANNNTTPKVIPVEVTTNGLRNEVTRISGNDPTETSVVTQFNTTPTTTTNNNVTTEVTALVTKTVLSDKVTEVEKKDSNETKDSSPLNTTTTTVTNDNVTTEATALVTQNVLSDKVIEVGKNDSNEKKDTSPLNTTKTLTNDNATTEATVLVTQTVLSDNVTEVGKNDSIEKQDTSPLNTTTTTVTNGGFPAEETELEKFFTISVTNYLSSLGSKTKNSDVPNQETPSETINIYKELILQNGSLLFDWWKQPPVRPDLKIYFYNVTNADDFLEGKKPVLDEIGPYVFTETWEKVEVLEHKKYKKGQISYRLKKVIKFDASRSAGNMNDTVVLPNIPMLGTIYQSKHSPRYLKLAMVSIMQILKLRPFVEGTVEQFLWGYEDSLLKLAKDVAKRGQQVQEKFGLMFGKNGTNNEYFIVNGNNEDKLNLFELINGKDKLDHYETDQCNRFDGSDGLMFPPHVTENTTVYIYQNDFCRKIPLRYMKNITNEAGIDGYRFTPPDNVFGDPARNPENKCFCADGINCPPNGLFNTSLCNLDLPLLISFPHFHLADPQLLDSVEGISPPDPEKHSLYTDIHPLTGVAISSKVRIQINLPYEKIIEFEGVTRNFRDFIFPIMWYEEGFDGLLSDATNILKDWK